MSQRVRRRTTIRGAVQGVGFRPFVYRLAGELELGGFVVNDAGGVILEVEGDGPRLSRFLARLTDEAPPHALIDEIETTTIPALDDTRFVIRPSPGGGAKLAYLLPDLATCPDCLRELFDPADRRFRYPFINCTACGPRFSIVRELPYDRPHTTMARFALCPACRAEYEDPTDRRFHAQPNACSTCGPSLRLTAPRGQIAAEREAALAGAGAALGAGKILALKGLGGFQLLVDATNAAAVARLRSRKHRWEKPLAIMVRDLRTAAALCEVDAHEAAALTSPQAPIVLLRRRADHAVAPGVAPEHPRLGVMLPTSPLHHLLLHDFNRPTVATSGNLSDEPICIHDDEALTRLEAIADVFLIHDRPIERHVDDSVLVLGNRQSRMLRRARGYAPLPLRFRKPLPTVLAVGGQLKNTVALSVGRSIFLSQHIGDLDNLEATRAHDRVIRDFLRMYQLRPTIVAHDLHPDYRSTQWVTAALSPDSPTRVAELLEAQPVPVQHHHAHLAACLGEHDCEEVALGAIWDGTGYGSDGTIWGGEFLLGNARGYQRFAHFRQLRLPGGQRAIVEPRRVAWSALVDVLGAEAAALREDLAPVQSLAPAERRVLTQLLEAGVQAPLCSSAGRLFDAVASLVGLRQRTTYEGQAAIELEHAASADEAQPYPLPLLGSSPPLILDWHELLRAILDDLGRGRSTGLIAARFHVTLADAIVRVARAAGVERVALGGGCFHNRLLLSLAQQKLQASGHQVLAPERVPAGDGGLSLGQVLVASATRELG